MARPISLSRFLSAAEPAPASGARPARDRAAQRPPILGALPVSAAEFSGLGYAVPDDYAARAVRGSRMRTVAGVFDEFAAALQFPYYFGGNKDAFDDCLRDLDDFIGPAHGYVVAVRDAPQVLADQPDERTWFESAMADCADYWAVRNVSFRVVMQEAAPPGVAAVPVEFDLPDQA